METDEHRKLDEIRKQDILENIPLAVFASTLIILGVFGNSMAIAFYGFKQRSTTVTNMLIAVLAVTDLIACVVFCDEIVVMVYSFKFTSVPLCKFIYVTNNWVVLTSVSLLTVTAMDRYRRICKPVSWQFTQRSAKIAVVVVTFFTLFLNIREAILADIVTKDIMMNDNSSVEGFVCTHTNDNEFKKAIQASHIINIITYVSLFSTIIVAYCMIVRKIVRTKYVLHEIMNKNRKANCLPEESVQKGKSNRTYEAHNDSVNKTENDIIDTVTVDTGSEETDSRVQSNSVDTGTEETDAGAVSETETFKEIDCISDSNNTFSSFRLPVEDIKNKQEQTIEKESQSEHSNAPIKSKRLMHKPVSKTSETERKITVMIAVVTMISILSFVPYFAVMLFVPRHISTENDLSNMGKKVARQFYMLNNVINPYIMCFFNSRFRDYVKKSICKCCHR